MAIKYSSVIGGSSAAADVILSVTKANTMYEVTGLTGYASLYQIQGTGTGSLFLEIWSAGSYITSIYQAYGTSLSITQAFDKLVFSSTAGSQNITLHVLPNVPTPITGATTLFTSSGTYSSTGYAYVVCIGGGGGGRSGTAYGYSDRYNYYYGTSGSSLGGQAGQYTLGYKVALSSNMTVTVGAGGGSNGNGGSSSFGGLTAAGGAANYNSGAGAVTTIPGIDAVTTSPKVSTARAISEALGGNYDSLSWAAGGSAGNVTSYGSAVSAGGSAGGTGTLGTGGSGAYAAAGPNTGYRASGSYSQSSPGGAGTGIGAGGGAGSGAAAYNNVTNGAGGSGTAGLVAITRFAS